MAHGLNVCSIPIAYILIENCFTEHITHISNILCIPIVQWLIERSAIFEHSFHIGNICSIPTIQWSIK